MNQKSNLKITNFSPYYQKKTTFVPMICNKDTAKKTAKLLLEIQAIKLQPKLIHTLYAIL